MKESENILFFWKQLIFLKNLQFGRVRVVNTFIQKFPLSSTGEAEPASLASTEY